MVDKADTLNNPFQFNHTQIRSHAPNRYGIFYAQNLSTQIETPFQHLYRGHHHD